MVIRARTAVLAAGLVLMGVLCFAAAALRAAPTSYTSCPHSDRTVPATNVPGARSELVLPSPTGVLLCRYRGLNPSAKRFRLLRSAKVIQAATVAELAGQFNELPSPPPGPIACPDDSGALIIAYFHYATGKEDVVRLDTSGCEEVSNGPVGRTAASGVGPNLVSRLEALTR